MTRPSARLARLLVVALAGLGLTVAGTTSAGAASAAAVTVPAAGVSTPTVDPTSLDMVPTPMAGLVAPDPARTQTPTIGSYVWALRQAGRKMFAGGMFTAVQDNATAAPAPQPFLAAFDVATGAFDSTCRPAFDNAVYALAVLPSGLLLVGGEFTTVNGQPHAGLVALDPATCQVSSAFPDVVARPYSTLRPIVRALQVVGNQVYVAGNFSRIVRGTTSVPVYKVARVDATTGVIDTVFKPAVTGSSVWDLAVDPARGQVHLAGWFSGVAGLPGTANYVTVDTTTGAVVPGLAALPRNDPAYPEVYTVTMGAPDRVFVGDSQHLLQMLDASSGTQLAFSHTGFYGCGNQLFYVCGYFGGGDYQVARHIGNWVFAGCHCNVDHAAGNPAQLSHYSSVTGTYTAHKSLMAYDPSTESLLDSFSPDIDGAVEGSWAVTADTLGCLYIGGDYTKGGIRAGRHVWLSGVARLCPKGTTPVADTKAPTAASAVQAADIGGGRAQVSWNAATDDVGVDHYHVVTASGASTDVAAAPATLTGVPAGTTTVTVTAVDAAGNVGPAATVTLTTGAGAVAPTAPTAVTAAASGGGTVLSWTASTDDVGVKSYLVYRNGVYAGWSATTTWTDAAAPHGTAAEYRLRAADAAGNNSVKSAPVVFTLP